MLNQFSKFLVIKIIKLYQKTLSFDHGLLKIYRPYGSCRYRPTCSDYTIEAIEKYQREVQSRPDYMNYNEVVDLSKGTNIKLTTTDLKNIGKVASRTDEAENKKKLAFIVSSNKAFFFARMYTMFRSFFKNSNKDIRVFNNESEAFEWLQKT